MKTLFQIWKWLISFLETSSKDETQEVEKQGEGEDNCKNENMIYVMILEMKQRSQHWVGKVIKLQVIVLQVFSIILTMKKQKLSFSILELFQIIPR